MLAQVLEVEGAEAEIASHIQIEPRNLRELAVKGFDTAVIAFLNANSVGHGRYLVRRLKRASPNLRVGIVLWDGTPDDPDEMAELAKRINADFVAVTMTDTVRKTLADEPPVRLAPVRTLRRRRLTTRASQPAIAK